MYLENLSFLFVHRCLPEPAASLETPRITKSVSLPNACWDGFATAAIDLSIASNGSIADTRVFDRPHRESDLWNITTVTINWFSTRLIFAGIPHFFVSHSSRSRV